jgi:hypothetical protein
MDDRTEHSTRLGGFSDGPQSAMILSYRCSISGSIMTDSSAIVVMDTDIIGSTGSIAEMPLAALRPVRRLAVPRSFSPGAVTVTGSSRISRAAPRWSVVTTIAGRSSASGGFGNIRSVECRWTAGSTTNIAAHRAAAARCWPNAPITSGP